MHTGQADSGGVPLDAVAMAREISQWLATWALDPRSRKRISAMRDVMRGGRPGQANGETWVELCRCVDLMVKYALICIREGGRYRHVDLAVPADEREVWAEVAGILHRWLPLELQVDDTATLAAMLKKISAGPRPKPWACASCQTTHQDLSRFGGTTGAVADLVLRARDASPTKTILGTIDANTDRRKLQSAIRTALHAKRHRLT